MSDYLKDILKHINSQKSNTKPIPFWSWNDKLEPNKLKTQIDQMHDNNIGGFFMHARGGLRTEYLSDEWMDCIKTSANYAQSKGMKAWIYDENGWPSGFVGGKLLEDPKNHDCYITYQKGDFDAEATISYDLTNDKLKRVTKCENNKEYLNLYINISPSTADILNPEVVDQFIELTHEKYKELFADEFSNLVGGFFTDEPQYFRWKTAYTNIMPDYFKEKYHEDLFDSLGLLFVEKDGYRLFRYRYWKAMQALMLNNYVKKIYKWCSDNNVAFTGHFVEENSIAWQMYCCGGIMPFYAYMTIPGIDWLGRRSSCELALRQVTSVAAQYGKNRIISETFGCCGWEATPRDYKRIADFQYCGGINLMCEHFFPYSEHGQRKRDYPAHFLSANPWIDNKLAEFNSYYTRLGNLIADSKEQINVAVLHPIRSVYFDFKRESDRYTVNQNTQFQKDLRTLSGMGISYHLLDEVLLEEDGFVSSNRIGCKNCSYDYLVLPHIICMDESTEKLLSQFVKNGGKVLIIGEKPCFREGLSFEYSYLESNCTLDEIASSQPFQILNYNTELYQTYRTINGKPFLFVDNSSTTNSHTQTYNLGPEIHSFKQLDLITLQEKSVPLTITLEPGQSAILFPDKAKVEKSVTLTQYNYKLNNTAVHFQSNQLRIDHVRYSYDGKNFSKVYPYEGLFEKLIKERYNGKIYIKYEFEVRAIPDHAVLFAEECKNSSQWINGKSFEFSGKYKKEEHVLTADISKFIKLGINEYVIQYDWYQGENVYYALFGENVTESLKNCLAYDTDIEAVYISGNFGVYSDELYQDSKEEPYVYGKNFYIGEVPRTVTEPTTDGFPFFTGVLETEQIVNFTEKNILLRLSGTWQSGDISINGKNAGTLTYETTMDISPFISLGDNIVKVDYTIGLRNLLGAHHYCGPCENGNISPFSYELTGTWHDGESKLYAERYNLIKLNT